MARGAERRYISPSFQAMFLNPIMMIILAGISLMVGTIVLTQTGSWLSVVPFVFFTFLFFLSLVLPVRQKRAPVPEGWVVPKPRKQLIKLTADRLREMGEAARPGTTVFHT